MTGILEILGHHTQHSHEHLAKKTKELYSVYGCLLNQATPAKLVWLFSVFVMLVYWPTHPDDPRGLEWPQVLNSLSNLQPV